MSDLCLGVHGRSFLQTWVDPDTGVANNFLDFLKSFSTNTEVVMLLILAVFAASHSGLAYLRPWGKRRLNLLPTSSSTGSCSALPLEGAAHSHEAVIRITAHVARAEAHACLPSYATCPTHNSASQP